MELVDYLKSHMPISSQRKAEISSVVSELNARYRSGESFDYDALCKDNNIRYFEHELVMFPITSMEDRVIVSRPFKNEAAKEFIKAHSLSHLLLNHIEPYGARAEANYFARELTNTDYFGHLSAVLHAVLDTGPKPSFYRGKQEHINFMIGLTKRISPIHPKE